MEKVWWESTGESFGKKNVLGKKEVGERYVLIYFSFVCLNVILEQKIQQKYLNISNKSSRISPNISEPARST